MSPEVIQALNQIFELCIIPLLGILVKYIIGYISVKQVELTQRTEDQRAQQYINMFGNTLITCIKATNQTYVNSLKAQGKFDAEAQKIAFEKTFTALKASLSEELKLYLTQAYGDLDAYLTNSIESTIPDFKKD